MRIVRGRLPFLRAFIYEGHLCGRHSVTDSMNMDCLSNGECRRLLDTGSGSSSPSSYSGSSDAVPLQDVTSTFVSTPNSTPSRRDRRSSRRWSWLVWLLLKVIGLYNCRRVVTRRWCHWCRLTALKRARGERLLQEEMSLDGEPVDWYGHGLYPGQDVSAVTGSLDVENFLCTPDENMNRVVNMDLESQESDCVVCQTEWWDSRGRHRAYTEGEIGVGSWNHPGSTLLSVIWPSALICLIAYDFFFFLRQYWGREKQLIRLISYSTYLLFNMSSPILTLVANIRNIMVDRWGTEQRHGFSWYESLGTQYIVKRLQYLDLAERGLPNKAYLGVCLVWPCLNGAYRIIIYFAIVENPIVDAHTQLSLMTGMVCLIVFGNFCYLISLLRLSFQKQMHLELAFLWRHTGELDVCRRRLRLFAQDLGSMCRLVSTWIILVVAVSTWAFTTQVCWDYLIMSNGFHFHNVPLAVNIDIMIWSENIMFLCLPLLAIGGTDLNRIWVKFHRSVSGMRCRVQEHFWDKVVCFCEEQSPLYSVQTLTLACSALGLFLGLHFGEQNVEYWMRPNNVNYTQIIPSMPDTLS